MKTLIAISILAVAGLAIFLLRRKTEDPVSIDAEGRITMSGPELLAMLQAQAGDPDPNANYLYIEIPAALSPLVRGEKYEDPLEETLTKHSLGTVDGGGSMMNADKGIDYVGIDVTVYDLDKSLPIIAKKMRALGAPKGTVIRHGDDETAPYDIWDNQK